MKKTNRMFNVSYTRKMATGKRLHIVNMPMTEDALSLMLSKEGRNCKYEYIVVSAELINAKEKGLFDLYIPKGEKE